MQGNCRGRTVAGFRIITPAIQKTAERYATSCPGRTGTSNDIEGACNRPRRNAGFADLQAEKHVPTVESVQSITSLRAAIRPNMVDSWSAGVTARSRGGGSNS